MASTETYTKAASGHAEQLIEDVRGAIAPEDEVLSAARERRDLVKKLAEGFRGTTRTFNSGSVAHGDANNPVNDADCGVVLDRRHHPTLGPDGDGAGPVAIVNELVELITPGIQAEYPAAVVTTTKRAVLIEFNDQIDDEDPSVDLVVALTRAEDEALWIPQLETDTWDPSDPEEHTRLLTEGTSDLRTHRARVLRLAKAAVANDEIIRGEGTRVMSSFNIEALALIHVTVVEADLGASLERFLAGAAGDIAVALTYDPAEVSDPIKLPEGVTRETASRRLAYFSRQVGEARAALSRAGALAALGMVYGPQLGIDPSSTSPLANELRHDERGAATTAAFGSAAAAVKPTRAFGDR